MFRLHPGSLAPHLTVVFRCIGLASRLVIQDNAQSLTRKTRGRWVPIPITGGGAQGTSRGSINGGSGSGEHIPGNWHQDTDLARPHGAMNHPHMEPHEKGIGVHSSMENPQTTNPLSKPPTCGKGKSTSHDPSIRLEGSSYFNNPNRFMFRLFSGHVSLKKSLLPWFLFGAWAWMFTPEVRLSFLGALPERRSRSDSDAHAHAGRRLLIVEGSPSPLDLSGVSGPRRYFSDLIYRTRATWHTLG